MHRLWERTTFLFSDTIRENIRFGASDADDTRVALDGTLIYEW